MRYELKSIYLENEELFAYVITNKDTGDFFEWTVSNITEPRFLLTDNGIIFKCSIIDENFIFEIVKSNGTNPDEKLIKNQNGNYLIFNSDDDKISIVYDFYDFPDIKREVAGNIIGEMLTTNGGGFLEDDYEYSELENKIINVLEKYKLFELSKPKRTIRVGKKPTTKKPAIKKEPAKEEVK